MKIEVNQKELFFLIMALENCRYSSWCCNNSVTEAERHKLKDRLSKSLEY